MIKFDCFATFTVPILVVAVMLAAVTWTGIVTAAL